MLSVPATHNRFGDRSFTAAGPRLWNELPADLRRPNLTFPVFKLKLKTYLFGLACSWDRSALWLFCSFALYKYSLCMYVCNCGSKDKLLCAIEIRTGTTTTTTTTRPTTSLLRYLCRWRQAWVFLPRCSGRHWHTWKRRLEDACRGCLVPAWTRDTASPCLSSLRGRNTWRGTLRTDSSFACTNRNRN